MGISLRKSEPNETIFADFDALCSEVRTLVERQKTRVPNYSTDPSLKET
jgi:ribosome-associated translation inhibitor RaiA